MSFKATKTNIPETGIFDAKQLGVPKMLLLGLQHLFAMFGATVLVPAITGLSVSDTLLFAGIGTLLFHLITGKKVPAFLGSSFAFLGAYGLMTTSGQNIPLTYSSFGVACAGMVYLVLALLFKVFGARKIMHFFPPIVTGPVIIAIGLTLSQTAINSCSSNWLIAITSIIVIIIFNIWGRGMMKIIPIMLGVVSSYVLAIAIDPSVRLTLAENVSQASWIGLPFKWSDTALSIFGSNFDPSMCITAVITIIPISLATIVEHIGDICAISSTTGKNYIKDPGLHRTLLGDGLATTVAALFGAPANTTYGENTGVLALSKVYDPRIIRIAAVFSIILSFCPKFSAVIISMPSATIGGVSLVLYGMISAVGIRNVVENNVDFTKSRNVIIAALILVLSIGIRFSDAGAVNFVINNITISLSGLAVASLVGIILNAALPGNDYSFDNSQNDETFPSFKV